MKTLFFECKMGAAGDMLAAALLELHPEPEKVIKQLNEMGLPNVEFKLEPSVKCGIKGKHFSVIVGGQEEESCDVHHHCHGHGHEYDHHHEEHDNECHHHDHCHEHEGCPHLDHNLEHIHNEEHSHDHCHEHEHHNHHHHEECSCIEHHHCHKHDHCHNHEGHEHHHHEHHGLLDIEHLVIEHLNIPQKVKEDVTAVYKIIAEAESKVHGVPVNEIHFHEVGSLDAVADITAVCFLINELKPEYITASPIHVGNGQVRCAHGILPVPAPATALILKGIPTYSGDVMGELCTPTGAALLKHFVSDFGYQPIMLVDKIGYGMGKKDFEQANCVRAILGDSEESKDVVRELCCNIDDMTAEDIAFAMERLFEAGALDVYTTPIGMKKNRSGILFTCMCTKEKRDLILNTMFKHTSTLGIRESICNRYVLNRKIEKVSVDGDEVSVKKVSGYGTEREKIEYNDLVKVALRRNLSLNEARKLVKLKTES